MASKSKLVREKKIVREKKREREENEKKFSFKTSQDVKMSKGWKEFLEHSEDGKREKEKQKRER